MSEHKQIQLYVGLDEGGCIDVGTIRLAGFTLVPDSQLVKLNTDRDELLAKLSLAGSIFNTLFSLPDAETTEETLAEADAWLQLKAVFDSLTPLGCLREIEAKAIESVITDELYKIIKPKGGKDCVIEVEDYLTQCAAKIRQEPPQL